MGKESKLILRSQVINYIYTFELYNKPLDASGDLNSEKLNEVQIKQIESISKNYTKFKALIEKFIVDGWSWTRLAPLERAILIYGAFELSYIDRALVINEMVILTQGYVPGDSYKFINSILEKVGDHFDKLKAS